MMRVTRRLVGVMLGMLLAACQQPTTAQQTAALTLSSDQLARRQIETRRYDTSDERTVLLGCVGVLQDLGFSIEESAPNAGLVVGSKDRDAVEAGQVASQVFLAALITALGGRADPVWERNQRIRLSIVTTPVSGGQAVTVRATFQRVIWNTKNQVSRVETLGDPTLYREFFERLSKAVFLEAHKV